MSRMTTPSFPGQMLRDVSRFDYGLSPTESVNRTASSLSPGAELGAGSMSGTNPWPAIGERERAVSQIRPEAAASDANAFRDWYPRLTPEQKDGFAGGHAQGEHGDLFGSFPTESSPGVQNPGFNKAADAEVSRDADNIEGITRTAAQQYFQSRLNGAQGTPAPMASATPAAPAAPASPSSPLLGPIGPTAAGAPMAQTPLSTIAGVTPVAGPPAPMQAPAAPALPPIAPHLPQHQAYQQQLQAAAQPAPQATQGAGVDLNYLRNLYARATSPVDRTAILRAIGAMHGQETSQQIASGRNQTAENVAGTNAAGKMDVAKLTTANLRQIADDKNNANATKAEAEIAERDKQLGETMRHNEESEKNARDKIAKQGQLTPEDVAKYRADWDKMNAARETNGLLFHAYPDYLSQSPGSVAQSVAPGATMSPATMIPGGAPQAPASPPAGATHTRVNAQTGKTEYLLGSGEVVDATGKSIQ